MPRVFANGLVILLIVVILSGCSTQHEWTRTDTALLAVNLTATALDGYCTAQIDPPYYERGYAKHFVGSDPEPEDTAVYFASVAAFTIVAARALPKNWRRFFLASGAAYSFYLVHDARDKGSCT